jgi:glycosyltransferase involved in cell wall biosynthesis
MTTNVQHFARGLSAEERRNHRAQLGVDGCVFLYVGRLWKGKGLLFLIDAFRQARLVSDAISLLLIGDGVDEKEIRAAADGIPGVTFKPFVQAAALPACYAAADVFVFPTLGDPHGQVIEEAHAAGLPVITSDAAGDVHLRVSDGANGFVVPAGDTHLLTHRMLELAADPDLRASMGGRGEARARMWGHEVYASGVEAMAHACLAAPRRATWAALGMSTAGHILMYTAGTARRAFHRQVRKFHP